MNRMRSTSAGATTQRKARKGTVSLAPLTVEDALRGLFQIPDPDATKPKKRSPRRKKAPED
jgi:hypothetical protein